MVTWLLLSGRLLSSDTCSPNSWGCRRKSEWGWGRDIEWVSLLIGAWSGPREQLSREHPSWNHLFYFIEKKGKIRLLITRNNYKKMNHSIGKVLANQQNYERKYERKHEKYNRKENQYWSITTSQKFRHITWSMFFSFDVFSFDIYFFRHFFRHFFFRHFSLSTFS